VIFHAFFYNLGAFLSPVRLDAIERRHGASTKPEYPSVLVTSGCQLGFADSLFVHDFFRRGWICGFLGATEQNGPWPLTPALSAEVNLARFVGRGIPFGASVQGLKECYYDHAPWALTY
jgi:hypothetical protein